jgi:hypothetical protein
MKDWTFMVERRVVYGCPKFYPANAVAEKFAALMNRKTFDQQNLRNIMALGFDIEIEAIPGAWVSF